MLRAGWALLKGLLWVAFSLVLGGVVGVAAVAMLLGTEAGTSRALGWVPGLQVVQPQGALLGSFQVQRVVLALPRGSRLQVDGLAWSGLSAHRERRAPWQVGLGLEKLSATAVDLQWHGDPDAPPASLPDDLGLPVWLTLADVSVGRVASNLLGDAGPLQGLRLSLAAQQPAPQRPGHFQHTLRLDHLAWQQWVLHGEVVLGTDRSLPLNARVQAALSAPLAPAQGSSAGASGQADVALQGSLRRFQATVKADVVGRPGGAHQRLQGRLDVVPLADWPVLAAQLSASRLDLNALVASVPATSLTGELMLGPRAGQPGAPGASARPVSPHAKPLPDDLVLALNLRNDLPGAWDGGRVPVVGIDLNLTLPGQASLGTLGQVGRQGEVRLALAVPARQPRQPGRLAVQGHWSLDDLQATRMDLRLDGVDLRALHGAAPALLLGGQGTVSGQAGDGWRAVMSLQGRDGGDRRLAQPVSAQVDGVWRPGRAELARLELQAGAARARLTGRWQQAPATGEGVRPWQASVDAALEAFDPAVWLPWPRAPSDARQPTRLHAQAHADLAHTGRWPDAVLSWRAALTDSILLGVPTQGRVSGQYRPVAAAGQPLGLSASLEGATPHNRLSVRVQWPAKWRPDQAFAVPAGTQVQARMEAPQLRELEPWLQSLGGQHLGGSLEGSGTWQADSLTRWSTQGQWKAREVKAEWRDQMPITLASLDARWAASVGAATSPTQPWLLDVQVQQARLGDRLAVPSLAARLSGTPAQHQLAFNARVDLPAAASAGQATGAPGPVAAPPRQLAGRFALDGRWLGSPEAGWQGVFRDLAVAPAPPGPESAVRPWLSAEAVPLAWRLDAGGPHFTVGASALKVFGTALNLQEAWWKAPAERPASLRLKAALPQLGVTELLKQMPVHNAELSGDLLLQGLLDVSQVAGQPWRVESSLQRTSGDLQLSDAEVKGGTPQRLGLRDFKLTLSAREGEWRLAQVLDARQLGTVSGHQTLRSAHAEGLPALDSELVGQVRADVANLNALAAWLPPGWRLGGHLQADVQLNGQLGSPLFNGVVQGQDIAIHNMLLGVNVAEGDVLARLTGQRFTIERFTAHDGAGGGTLRVTGGASFDPSPSGQLTLSLQRFAVMQRVDLRVRVSGEARWRIDPSVMSLQGQFSVDDGLVDIGQASAPTLGDDVTVINRPGQARQEAPVRRKAAPSSRDLQADVSLDLGQNLRLFGRGLDTRMAGQLRATTPRGQLRVSGVVNTVGGTFAAYGQKLAITRGRVIFTGVVDNPRLDIEATRPQSPLAQASDVRVGVLIAGTATEPRVRLFSEPPMSDTERLSWLVLGRGTSGLGGADFLLLQTAAAALLGPDSLPTDTLLSAFGLDDFSVRQSEVNAGDTVVAVGRRISERWYLGFEQSVSGAETHWQLIYRLGQRLTMRVQTGTDTALDLIWSFVWD